MMAKPFVFVSPFKGGSTSVGAALMALGYVDTGHGRQLLSAADGHVIDSLNTLMEAYETLDDVPQRVREGVDAAIGGVLRGAVAAGGYTCASDWPLGHDRIHPFVRKIVFPDAKFVFLEREPEEYARSFGRQVRADADPARADALARLWDVAGLGDDVAAATYARWRATYQALARTAPEDVLFMRVQDGWAPLCAFLGRRPPRRGSFPWRNSSHPPPHAPQNNVWMPW